MRSLFAANLKGYYKLGFSTNQNDLYKNFAASPSSGTEQCAKVGTGNVGFEESDLAGEQSTFDSRKNHGDDEGSHPNTSRRMKIA